MFYTLKEKIQELQKHNSFLIYLKNASWLFFEKLLRLFISLLVSVWVVRYLGPERFGQLSYSQSYVGLFTAFASLGLDGILVRELLKGEKSTDELMSTSFGLRIIGALCLLGVITFATIFTSNDHLTNSLIYTIALSSIFQSFNVIDLYFQSRVLSKFVVFANVITLLISSLVKVVLILNKAPVIAFAWALVLDSIILALTLLFYYNKTENKVLFKNFIFKRNTALSLLKDSWPLILSGFVIAIYMKIDQVIIKELLGNEAVGQYSVAVRISELWYFIPMVLGSSFFPAIINAKKQNEKLYYDRLQKLYDLMIWIALAIAIPMTFFSNILVDLLYGKAYTQAASVLSIHIWSGVFVFLGVASSNWLLSENLQKYSIINTTIGALINLVLNYIFIPKMGIAGAAWATLIAQAFASYLSLLFWKKTRLNFWHLTKALFLFRLKYIKNLRILIIRTIKK